MASSQFRETYENKIHTTFISLAKMYNSAALAGSLESHILQALTKRTKLIKKFNLNFSTKATFSFKKEMVRINLK